MKLGLTDEQKAARLDRIGASDLNIICGGDDAKVLRLWEEKTRAREPDDLSDILPVIMGQFTEPLNRYWFTKQTGLEVTCAGEEREAKVLTFPLVATLDGLTEDAVFEAKHVHSNSGEEKLVQKYMPQLHGQMVCAACDRAYLSVFFGNADWRLYEVEYDEEYGEPVLNAALRFWQHVMDKTPPVDIAPPPPPVPFEKLKQMDMEGNNEWASFAADWIESKDAAKLFDKATKEIKALVPADVGEATGHGITVKRAKNNSLRIGETK